MERSFVFICRKNGRCEGENHPSNDSRHLQLHCQAWFWSEEKEERQKGKEEGNVSLNANVPVHSFGEVRQMNICRQCFGIRKFKKFVSHIVLISFSLSVCLSVCLSLCHSHSLCLSVFVSYDEL